jgi:signal peptidase I
MEANMNNANFYNKLFCILLICISIFISSCCCDVYTQASSNMHPTIIPGSRLVVKNIQDYSNLERFSIVLINYPHSDISISAIRIIGMPGEQLELLENGFAINNQRISTNGLPEVLRRSGWLPKMTIKTNTSWNLEKDEFFGIGDNLDNAKDSRYIGPVKLTNIIGIITDIMK